MLVNDLKLSLTLPKPIEKIKNSNNKEILMELSGVCQVNQHNEVFAKHKQYSSAFIKR